MPRVPTYDAQVTPRALPRAEPVQLRPVGLPSVPGTAGEQMQRTGAAIGAAGDQAGRIALQMQDRENADALFKAEAALKTDYLTFEQAARERRGEAAKGLAAEGDEWWTTKASEYANGLGNEAQRRLFEQTVVKLRQQSLATLATHEATERRASLNASAEASIEASINLAAGQVGMPTEPAAVAGAKTDILKRLGVLRALNGWDDNIHEAKTARALTNLHMQVIQNKLNVDPAAAREYFELNKGEISGSQYDPIERSLKVGASRQKAQSVVDELMAGGLDETEGLRVIREKLSGEDEALAVQEWKVRIEEGNQARERAQRTAADAAWGLFARGGMRAVPSSLLAQLDGRTVLALRKAAEEKATGKEPKTDSEVYYGLRQMLADDPEAFRRLDLRQYFPSLSRADREEFIKLQTKPEEIKDAATLDQQLSNMHDQMGWGASDRKKKGDFDRIATGAINQEQQRIGRKLNYDERQKIIDRLVVEGKVEGAGFFGFGGSQRLFEAVEGPKAATFKPTVPKGERQKIEAALKRAGQPVTDEAVLRLYRSKVGL